MENEPYYSSGYDIYLHRSLYGKTGTYDSVSIGNLLSEGSITVGGSGEATIGEGSIDIGKLETMPSILGWTHTLSFSASDLDTVAWSAGAITLSDGTVYNIAAGNTGNMTARNYIYLDTGSSLTVLQTTTTASSAVGSGKIMVATAINSAIEANFFVFSGSAQNVLAAGNLEQETITANELATNAVSEAKIAADAVTALKINVAALNGLTGNLNINTVDTTQIVNNAVDTLQIAADAVVAAKISVNGLDGTSGDIAANHIVAGMITTGAITTAKIYAGAVTADEIGAGAVVAGKIYAGTIVANDIASGAITAITIAADAVTAPKINVVGLGGESGRILVTDATDANVVSGAINTYATTLIQAGKIVISGTTNLDDWRNSTDTTKIEGGNIYTNTVAAAQIAANTITASEIFGNTITANEIAANTITASQIATGTITATQIAATTITAAKIVTGTITATQLAANSVTTSEINVGTLSGISANIGTITSGSITGTTITSAAGTTYIRLATGNYLQFVRSGTEKGRIWSDNSGDIYIRGTDDVVFNAGNAARCGAYSDSFKPVAGGYDLGKDNVTNRFDWVFANYYSSQGHTGEQGNYEFMTKLRLDLNPSGEVYRNAGSYYEKKAVTIWGGIVTTVGATQTVAHGTFLT